MRTYGSKPRTVGCLASVLLALCPTAAQADAPPAVGTEAPAATSIVRKGFTLEMGIGAAYVLRSGKSREQAQAPHVEVAPFSLSLGGFLTRDLSLLFRATTIISPSHNESITTAGLVQSERSAFVSIGVAAQYFLSDRFFLGAGVAQGSLSETQSRSDGSTLTSPPRSGFVVTARAGYAFVTLEHHAFSLVTELTPGFFGTITFIGNTLQVQWQYYLPVFKHSFLLFLKKELVLHETNYICADVCSYRRPSGNDFHAFAGRGNVSSRVRNCTCSGTR